jgi:hypothetical protein
MLRSCCRGAVADDDPAPAVSPHHEDGLFQHGLIYKIWVGNEYGMQQTFPDSECGYYKRNVYSDGPFQGVLIDGKAFTGAIGHTLQMHDTWGLNSVGQGDGGHVVLTFRSGEHTFHLEEDPRREKRLWELEKNCYKNNSAATGDGATVSGDLHRRAGYQPQRQLSDDSI